MRHSLGVLLLLCFLLGYSTFSMAGPLPPASDFRLTLRQDPHSALPLTASCDGEAAQTLTCQAFVVTLENLSQHTIRLSRLTCREAEVAIFRQIPMPNSASEWVLVSDQKRDPCPTTDRINTRLRPHESTEFETRLISPRRESEGFALPGSYTLRAQWVLFGCAEEPEGANCPASGSEPVEVVSNEVRAESPTPQGLGEMRLSFHASVIPASQAATLHPDLRAKCPAGRADSIECVAFHYRIENSGTRAVRLSQGCGEIFPEYSADGEWRPIIQTLQCTLNVSREMPILPGGVVESDFTLAWGYDISPFRNPGEYTVRLTLTPTACFASPDGRFCLTKYNNLPPITSSELSFRTQ